MSSRRWVLLVIALPALVLALARVVLLAMAMTGAHPFWPWSPLTLSEAAALRDGGEVARLLAQGADPNGTYPVRRGFLYGRTVQMTPMAAAVAAQRPEIVQILEDAGGK